MDLLDRLAALSDYSYQKRPPRRDPRLDRLWRALRQMAQWLWITLALLWRYGQRIAYRLSFALERARCEMLQTSRPLALRLMSNRRAQGVAALIGVCALIAHAGLASAQFIQPGMGIPGWSFVEQARCIACQVADSPNAQHTLTADEYADLLMGRMTLDEQLGQLIIVQFAGQSATPEALRMVTEQGVGGALSFAANIQTSDQTRAMTSDLQHAAAIPLLMSVDQEGGLVNRFRAIIGSQPGANTMTTPDIAYQRGQHDAQLLQSYGYNLNLAPVVDVGTANPQLLDRTFGSDPQMVATLAGAYMAGLQQSGAVTACLKHFPGIGATTTDPHVGLPSLTRSSADWERIDLAPYRTLLATGNVHAIMVTHEMIPAVDSQYPSSLSPAVIDGELRQKLGFQGVVITDSLVMGALNNRWTVAQAAALAMAAGADIVIGPQNAQVVAQVKDALKAALSSGKLSQARIETSVKRILKLKITMDLLPIPHPSSQATPTSHSMPPTNTPKKNAK
ncbi:MAG TPA: glycoside hydrolase family 3 N-terminal domain-containing protein [Ktedonobacterales bacterium]